MPLDSLLEQPVYAMDAQQKHALLLEGLNALTQHHYMACEPYHKLMDALGIVVGNAESIEQIPMIPVRLFKHYALKSIPDDQVVKILTSSGTTSQQVSKIYLDKETASYQTKILVKIIQNYLGKQRLPMLIVDTEAVVKNRNLFSARGAGILGLSNFGRYHTYLLDEAMSIDMDQLRDFMNKHPEGPIFMFGFTFMIWQYLYQPLKNSGETIDFSRVILIHSGGWKKLQEIAVDNAAFKQALQDRFGIKHVHNFYGMVEQVGSIFVECEEGHLHTPSSADIIIRDPHTFLPLEFGKVGVVQVLSLIPRSYPGHSLLSEDLGIIHGEDDCRCGKKGKYFSILGRIPKAEMRGCSDTHAASKEER